jgi:hypothetical protein
MKTRASQFLGAAESFCGHAVIDTPFQRGGRGRELVKNRFQRFIARETAEAVATTRRLGSTPLKRGVNETSPWRMPKK